jgi:hypothetical protein
VLESLTNVGIEISWAHQEHIEVCMQLVYIEAMYRFANLHYKTHHIELFTHDIVFASPHGVGPVACPRRIVFLISTSRVRVLL